MGTAPWAGGAGPGVQSCQPERGRGWPGVADIGGRTWFEARTQNSAAAVSQRIFLRDPEMGGDDFSPRRIVV